MTECAHLREYLYKNQIKRVPEKTTPHSLPNSMVGHVRGKRRGPFVLNFIDTRPTHIYLNLTSW